MDWNRRVAAWAVAMTSAIMFSALVLLAPLVASSKLPAKLVSIAVAALSSFGLYKVIASLLLVLFGKWQFVRRLLLGEGFLEGTWVGHYQRGGLDRYTVEIVDQRHGETRIEGREFDENLKTRADWSSETSFVDLRRGRLIYVYSCDVYETKHQQNGIGVFKLVRSRQGKSCDKLDGYAVDTLDGHKDPNTEYKISSDFVDDDTALRHAREIFKAGAR